MACLILNILTFLLKAFGQNKNVYFLSLTVFQSSPIKVVILIKLPDHKKIMFWISTVGCGRQYWKWGVWRVKEGEEKAEKGGRGGGARCYLGFVPDWVTSGFSKAEFSG